MDLWDRALESLDQSERQQFPTGAQNSRETIQQLLKIVQEKRDSAHRKRWKFKKSDGSVVILRDVLEKTFKSISRYFKVIDGAVSVDPLHAASAWAVIRLLLQFSMDDVYAYGCMSEGIEIVATIISRYEILERLYLPSTAFSTSSDNELHRQLCQCIVKVYSTILTYLARANKFWSYKTAIRVAKGIFSGMEQLHNELQSSIQKADDETNRVINLLQSQQRASESKASQDLLVCLQNEISMPIIRMARNLAEISDKLSKEQRKETLQWLSSVPCENQHREAARKIVRGTGKWLLTRPEYDQWQRSSESSIFWLHGIPGSGKSKLTSIVIESILELHKVLPLERPPLAYFYCSKNGPDSRSQDPLEIMSALLRQLTGSDPSSPLRGSVALEFENRAAKSYSPPRLSLEEVVDYILQIAADDPAILVIDALDEIGDSDNYTRWDFFSSLERVVHEADNVVKIFLSSRKDGDIVNKFEGCLSVGIQESMNANDIEVFTERKIEEAVKSQRMLRGRVSESLRHDMIEILTKKAQGMFRWVELSIETLSNPKRIAVERDARSELGKLPAKLHDQYQTIYSEILEAETSTASIAKRAFGWMLAAQRALSVEEMLGAVAFDNDGYFHEDLDVDGLLGICRNLLIVTSLGGNGSHSISETVFQMAHLSVREFLEQLPEFSSIQIHTAAVSRLLDDVDLDQPWDGQGPAVKQPDRSLQHYSIYLFEHAERSSLCDMDCDLAEKMKSFLFDNDYNPTKNLREWIRTFKVALDDSFLPEDSRDAPFLIARRYNYSPWDGGVYISCAHGLLSVLQLLVDDDRAPWKSYRTTYHVTGLYGAIEKRKYAVAEWLLQKQIYHPDECHGHVPALYTAAWDKEKELVSLLLKHGGDPLSRYEQDFASTPWRMLFAPLRKGSSLLIGNNFEIFKEMFYKIQDMVAETPNSIDSIGFDWKFEGLLCCLLADWKEASEFSIQRGANDKVQTSTRTDFDFPEDDRRASSLQIAVRHSQFAVVAALLSHSRECHSGNPGSSKDMPDAKSIKHRLYVNYLDDRGQSALHYLMLRAFRDKRENEKIMDLLLQHGADPHFESNEKVTALHIAAHIGSTSLVQRLMSQGLRLDTRSSSGATALHFASRGAYNSPETLRFLFHCGLKPVEKDSEGNTPLHYAAASCNSEALVELFNKLLEDDGLEPVVAINKMGPQLLSKGAREAPIYLEKLAQYVNLRNHANETLLHVTAKDLPSSYDDQVLPRGLDTLAITQTMDLLVDLGSNVNGSSTVGKTPLLLMHERRSSITVIKHILSRGADPNLPDAFGKTALHCTAATYHMGERSELLLDAGANIEAEDCDLCTPLHFAVKADHPDVVRVLISRGADIDSQSASGESPLHHAAMDWDNEILHMLAKRGGDVNCRDTLGLTPLHVAASNVYKDNVEDLLRFGANPEAISNTEKTPLHCTFEYAGDVEDEWSNYGRRPNQTWLTLYHASEKWCKDKGIRPHTLLKRVSSQILRRNRPWGNFDKVKPDLMVKM